MIVGIDEAGRGPLAGNVVACACFLPLNPPFIPKDSKKLSALQREKMFGWLKGHAVYGLGEASAQEIDAINILNATFLAFERAIDALLIKEPKLKAARFVIDGNRFKTKKDIDFQCVIKADTTVPEVSCASVMAKVTRDRQMTALHIQYPQYNFLQHKGYPTQEHYAAIQAHDITPFHRKSFRLFK
jgi:ribonuclease HII